MPRIFLVVVDGLGVFPDGGKTSSLRSICKTLGTDVTQLETLCNLGLECAVTGRGHLMTQLSVPVGSEEGHREMFGLVTKTPHPVPSEPLPSDIFTTLEKRFGIGFIGNEQGRGKDVVPKYWRQHLESSSIIVYRGIDSVVVISAEECVLDVEQLYEVGAELRVLLNGIHGPCVKKVIVKPLRNRIPIDELRRDYFQKIDGDSLIHDVVPNDWRIVINQKVFDILGFSADEILHTRTDKECMWFLSHEQRKAQRNTFMMINLEDYDRYAHLGEANRCWQTLSKLNMYLHSFIGLLYDKDWLIVTGDHGIRIGEGDLGLAHSREAVPLLCFSKLQPLKDIPCHRGFSIVGKTVAEITRIGYVQALLSAT